MTLRYVPAAMLAAAFTLHCSLADAASVRREIVVERPPEYVWEAVRDFGALHRRLVPGFVTAVELDGTTRIVTFANGTQAREVLVDSDDRTRRLVYAVVGGRLTAHSASVQVFAEGKGNADRLDRRFSAERAATVHRRPDGRSSQSDEEGSRQLTTHYAAHVRRHRIDPRVARSPVISGCYGVN